MGFLNLASVEFRWPWIFYLTKEALQVFGERYRKRSRREVKIRAIIGTNIGPRFLPETDSVDLVFALRDPLSRAVMQIVGELRAQQEHA